MEREVVSKICYWLHFAPHQFALVWCKESKEVTVRETREVEEKE
jgi:hypothetical protein